MSMLFGACRRADECLPDCGLCDLIPPRGATYLPAADNRGRLALVDRIASDGRCRDCHVIGRHASWCKQQPMAWARKGAPAR